MCISILEKQGCKVRAQNPVHLKAIIKDFKQTISFISLERICNKEKASERGIYKLTRNTQNEKSYCGKFYVILKKVNDTWNILLDYDAYEKNTINERSYQEAFEIKDFEKYKK